ncbi:GNAT family N-acetyltransferase [Rufibacter psychrotolerans]|uniref:GNAT family N-acetyltransferase n=1 Tax=Rufibacter psychrotolerans TaxID=2812556 RepID=UPI00196761C1|nr:GNAT family N-acetyltransferase [Rufibacter sp. SYSU D00308]
MQTLLPILSTATPEFALAWQLYEEAFPPEERRSLVQQTSLLTNPRYQLFALEHQHAFAGLLCLWQLPGFTFLEHFAVLQHLRGQGVGAAVLQAFLTSSEEPVILETEPPTTQIAARRIRFYERAGFHLNQFDYWQPPYSPQKPWVELRLMSYPRALEAGVLEKVKRQVYQHVYGVDL